MSEDINGIQYATADVFKHVGNMSIKLMPFILPHCGAFGAR
jgi:hypothetical protein